MLTLQNGKKIYVYTQPIDMRKSIDGLVIHVAEAFDRSPQAGDLHIFTNRRRDKVKCLVWDHNGYALYYKRLDRGRFHYSKYLVNGEIVITEGQFKALCLGMDFHLLEHIPNEKYEGFF